MTSWPSKSTLQRLLDLAGLHYTTSERSGPFWQSMLHNFLSRPLSFLGWTTCMLFWLDFHHTQSNLYKWFRMQLASSSRHWCLHIEQPQAQHPPTSTHYYKSTSPPEVWDLLVSNASWYHHREAAKSLSRTFSFTVPGRWNDLPTPIRNAGSLSIFKQQLKTHLFRHYLTSSKKKTKKKVIFLSLLTLLACIYLNNAWDLVLWALPLSVCLFNIKCFMYSPIGSRFG